MRQAVGLHAQKDDVHCSRLFERANNFGPDLKISFSALHLHAVFLHGFQMRPTREERDIKSSSRHARTDVSADCPGSHDQEFHALVIHQAAATARRRIFPVAVVGILGTK